MVTWTCKNQPGSPLRKVVSYSEKRFNIFHFVRISTIEWSLFENKCSVTFQSECLFDFCTRNLIASTEFNRLLQCLIDCLFTSLDRRVGTILCVAFYWNIPHVLFTRRSPIRTVPWLNKIPCHIDLCQEFNHSRVHENYFIGITIIILWYTQLIHQTLHSSIYEMCIIVLWFWMFILTKQKSTLEAVKRYLLYSYSFIFRLTLGYNSFYYVSEFKVMKVWRSIFE